VSALNKLRILELSGGVAGEYCGKLLADFGAEVIKIEAPGEGSDTRRKAPLDPSGTMHERSGLFAYLNTNKRSVTLNVAGPRGREILASLANAVDAIIDDHPKGYLTSLGLDPDECETRIPGLIICSVTPFGYDAPVDRQKAYSLNVFQASGWGYHSPSAPEPGTPPLKGAGRFLVDYESGLSAATALMAALCWKSDSGRGQFVDVSQQASMASLAYYVLGQMVAGNMEVSTSRSAFDLGGPASFFECRDGYVYLFITEPGHWNGLYKLMHEPAWMLEFPERWLELHLTDERIQRCRTQIALWMKDQSRMEVAERAQKLGVPMVPVNTVKDVLDSAQMRHREYFAELDHPTLGCKTYPTVPYQLSATPARLETPAPLLGQHTEQILGAVGGIELHAVGALRDSGVI
jgi:crotonobetainyl-CoA:carnitine CoA-transferase CaiB-like acyl-CoA transferase